MEFPNRNAPSYLISVVLVGDEMSTPDNFFSTPPDATAYVPSFVAVSVKTTDCLSFCLSVRVSFIVRIFSFPSSAKKRSVKSLAIRLFINDRLPLSAVIVNASLLS